MNEFLERLKDACVIAIIASAFTTAIFGLAWLLSNYNWLSITVEAMIMLVAVVVIIIGAYKFINWLFIEPFRKREE
ncbi:hypothetical protein N007_05290 [Alicyclobacillus acidoterrestris ATCC 49025]|nr:hypothetical protein N007_05290 [Alicyclobacillus acidoterrestris ATCC 49025]